MRLLMILLPVASMLVLGGCDSPALISLEPAVTAPATVFDPTLLGTWEAGQGGDLCILRRAEDNAYAITYVAGGLTREFEGRLFLAGEARLMDLSPTDSDDFQIPGHTLIRILSSSGTLRWAYLDSEWLRQHAAGEPANRPRDGNKLLLTVPGERLTSFLLNYAADERAHGDVVEWRRLQ